MYLKSIEIQGFKSFANRILLEFHNGITGIVGPNGSGKSNVADAVRWVLGEQRARQLRGESMQDVIFAGTENRKPLSYAYVAITLDNADHQLAVDYEEVTVARRVYRSGESEYLINGSTCRLKDVHELFYDTGIGKEGYSIIGQGQIERILSGRPEERRELFDEAAGIVKFKRRKATAQKKLEQERENLVRVTDILSEQEKQLQPLEKQSETARIYLKKKEELKECDVNLFLLRNEELEKAKQEADKNLGITNDQLAEKQKENEEIRSQYAKIEQDLEEMDAKILNAKDQIAQAHMEREKMEGQINVQREQIRMAQMNQEHVRAQREELLQQQKKQQEAYEGYESQRKQLQESFEEVQNRKQDCEKELQQQETQAGESQQELEECKKAQVCLMEEMAGMKAKRQRCDTLEEQVNIRKAQLTQRLLQRKSEEADLNQMLEVYEQELEAVTEKIRHATEQQQKLDQKRMEWKQKLEQQRSRQEEVRGEYQKCRSRFETLQNIAERYDGYGNSIRKVMEQKEQTPGLIGVVAELMEVDAKYETAIEIALGGGIRNIVTADEKTAKEMITYLKKNRYGRATFLPLTSVGKNLHFRNPQVLEEEGVIGRANTLVKSEECFAKIMEYLLGRIVVVDTLDHATQIARKYQYSLHLVTLDGESLSPGGSMTGGAFKNSGNLLGRRRELEELKARIEELRQEGIQIKKRLDDIDTARVLLKDDLEEIKEQLQELYLQQNTARLQYERATEQKTASDKIYQDLKQEHQKIEQQLEEIKEDRVQLKESEVAQQQMQEELRQRREQLEQNALESSKQRRDLDAKMTKVRLEEANVQQQMQFVEENQKRILEEKKRLEEGLSRLAENREESSELEKQKEEEIQNLQRTMEMRLATIAAAEQLVSQTVQEKEAQNQKHKSFFDKREALTTQIAALDKEVYRLNSQLEKIAEELEKQINYMWEEYEITPHSAVELRANEHRSSREWKEEIHKIRNEIRQLGTVNVNAIEDYKELLERYQFLKEQHDDLVTAEETLLGIIEELDAGMRRQFAEKFAQIQREFDQVFRELFGGGKGTLELVEEEDLLECGIRIIAQPPGKKLQNMMQLSGGEKSLTAIALLFAIQNLKPSPFCLLDEIEAALDDSNVTRFAKYLGKLTRNTQFIVITHRRGSMAASDRLYGITMQEKGVSTLVSVNLIENDLDK